MNAGYGSRVQFPDHTCEELYGACGAFSSNYEPEAKAIEATLHSLSDILTQMEKEKKDKSVLKALENDDSKDKTIRKFPELLKM